LRNFESLSLKLLTVFGSCGLFVVAGNFSSESFIDYQNRIELRQLNQLVLRRAARKLGIKTIAEGIEQPSQLSWLRDIGVDEGQGVLAALVERNLSVPRTWVFTTPASAETAI
jgi:EAL domain-containing protein (putative c-di-GMP-specific phosphodiesterase class I)